MEVSSDSSFDSRAQNLNLLIRYLNTILIEREGDQYIDAWNVLKDLSLVKDLVQELISCLDINSFDGVCILADSGIPLGVVLAQSLHKPMYFYRRRTWSGEMIQPYPPKNASLLLVDSHIRSGYTADSCVKYLRHRGISVSQIAFPISFSLSIEKVQHYNESLKYIFLTDSSEEYAAALARANDAKPLGNKRQGTNTGFDTRHYDGTGYLLSKTNRFKNLVRNILFNRQEPDIQIINNHISERLRRIGNTTESQIWNIFIDSVLIEDVCSNIEKYIDLDKIDVIVGTGPIGTIFALCIVSYTTFSKCLISTLQPEYEWDIDPFIEPKKALVCSGRLRTGQYIAGTVKALERKNTKVDQVVVLQYVPEGVKFPRNRLISTLNELKLEIIAFSKKH